MPPGAFCGAPFAADLEKYIMDPPRGVKPRAGMTKWGMTKWVSKSLQTKVCKSLVAPNGVVGTGAACPKDAKGGLSDFFTSTIPRQGLAPVEHGQQLLDALLRIVQLLFCKFSHR